jgi:hypothetical protein
MGFVRKDRNPFGRRGPHEICKFGSSIKYVKVHIVLNCGLQLQPWLEYNRIATTNAATSATFYCI